ncbi:MAG: hypothetical protein HC800_00110 [Phormidesmis sp. RL_2_1]|nr:hypothetical protein [Phormidesmis sp. RL_2_1]
MHDRVQQAAYSLIPERDKQAIHLKIGQRLLQETASREQSQAFFAMVGQLNKGRNLLQTSQERNHLAQLNLKAGRKAKAATAYSTAVDYCNVSRQLLSENSWLSNYATTLEIFVESLESEYLSTNFDVIEPLAATILEQTQDILDNIKVHEVRIRAWIGQGDQHKALEIGLKVLSMLEITLLEEPPQVASDISALIDAPTMSDLHKLAAMDIMTGIITSAWAVSPIDFRRLAFTMVSLSLHYGNCPASSFGYAWYGTILCEVFGEIDTGYAFGQLAVALVNHFDERTLRAKVLNIYATCIGPWKSHAKHCLDFHLDGLQAGLETGDLEFASYDAAEHAQYLFLIGKPLTQVKEDCQQKLSIIKYLEQGFHIDYLAPWFQATLNLLGHKQDARKESRDKKTSESPTLLDGEIYREQDRLPALVNKNS